MHAEASGQLDRGAEEITVALDGLASRRADAEADWLEGLGSQPVLDVVDPVVRLEGDVLYVRAGDLLRCRPLTSWMSMKSGMLDSFAHSLPQCTGLLHVLVSVDEPRPRVG